MIRQGSRVLVQFRAALLRARDQRRTLVLPPFFGAPTAAEAPRPYAFDTTLDAVPLPTALVCILCFIMLSGCVLAEIVLGYPIFQGSSVAAVLFDRSAESRPCGLLDPAPRPLQKKT